MCARRAAVKSTLIGVLGSILGPLVAPYMVLIAQLIQLMMGVMAVLEMGVSFKEIHTAAQAIITLIMTARAAPPSALPHGSHTFAHLPFV